MNTEYAMKNGVLIHISKVEHGLKCDCACPACGEKMIARKGSKTTHHFAHAVSDCQYSLETALHIMAKDILENEKRIKLPKVEIQIGMNRSAISEDRFIEFDEVTLEKRLESIVPDILIRKADKYLIIEIYVTNKVGDEKQKAIENKGVSAIEINLSKLNKSITKVDLRRVLIDEVDCKYWIFNKIAFDYEQKLFSLCEKRQEIERYGHCKYFVGIYEGHSISLCYKCDYNMREWKVDMDVKNGDVFDYILCSAKTGIKTFNDLKTYNFKDGRILSHG